MATRVGPRARGDVSAGAGTVALVLVVLCTVAVVLTYVLSLIETFNPPNWIRVVGSIWIPIAFGGVPIAYFGLARHAAAERGVVSECCCRLSVSRRSWSW